MQHLSKVQRYAISVTYKKKSQTEIARNIDISKSTICRELKRNMHPPRKGLQSQRSPPGFAKNLVLLLKFKRSIFTILYKNHSLNMFHFVNSSASQRLRNHKQNPNLVRTWYEPDPSFFSSHFTVNTKNHFYELIIFNSNIKTTSYRKSQTSATNSTSLT